MGVKASSGAAVMMVLRMPPSWAVVTSMGSLIVCCVGVVVV